jgi:alpha-acetolactate decarboxylase
MLFCYNTVERLLRGDFYHTVDWDSASAALTRFPGDWPLIGIGTTNWFKRNGETIVQGTVAQPQVFWSDPEGEKPMQVINLQEQNPSAAGPALRSPSADNSNTTAAFPFLAVAVAQPDTVLTWDCPTTENLHQWIQEKLAESNIGLAAVFIEGPCSHVRFASAFYLPLEGLKLSDGYNAKNNLKLSEHEQGYWSIGGIYAANPTLQNIISVEGLPLHLHGYEKQSRLGGHITQIKTSGCSVKVWPIKDLVMELKNLDQAWKPMRNLALAD